MKPFWWILELIPLKFRYQRRDDVWISEFRCVQSVIPGLKPSLHFCSKVKLRASQKDPSSRAFS